MCAFWSELHLQKRHSFKITNDLHSEPRTAQEETSSQENSNPNPNAGNCCQKRKCTPPSGFNLQQTSNWWQKKFPENLCVIQCSLFDSCFRHCSRKLLPSSCIKDEVRIGILMLHSGSNMFPKQRRQKLFCRVHVTDVWIIRSSPHPFVFSGFCWQKSFL